MGSLLNALTDPLVKVCSKPAKRILDGFPTNQKQWEG